MPHLEHIGIAVDDVDAVDLEAVAPAVRHAEVFPRGANVTLSPWLTHRHPGYWEAPERFDPDRFLPERSEGRPRGAYFPFGAGGRRQSARIARLRPAAGQTPRIIEGHRSRASR